jgi:hypothetical protein
MPGQAEQDQDQRGQGDVQHRGSLTVRPGGGKQLALAVASRADYDGAAAVKQDRDQG